MSTTTPLEPDSFAITANLAQPAAAAAGRVLLVAVLALGIAGLLDPAARLEPRAPAWWSPSSWLRRRAAALVAAGRGPPRGGRPAGDRRWSGPRSASSLVPLVWLIWLVVKNGLGVINGEFLTYDMRNVVGAGGGIYHALWGTLLVTLAAAIISVPIGLFTAIYLVEYGRGNRLARVTTFLVDVMTGIPSIVAGLFALSLFVLIFGPAIRIGFGGAVALSLLMIPTVVRSAEEMLRLVPSDLREASYALGMPKWRTIVKVVLPTALGGIITGVVLAISRVIGETAPLLVVAGATDSVNFNLFDGRMMTLPVYIFTQYSSPASCRSAWRATRPAMPARGVPRSC